MTLSIRLMLSSARFNGYRSCRAMPVWSSRQRQRGQGSRRVRWVRRLQCDVAWQLRNLQGEIRAAQDGEEMIVALEARGRRWAEVGMKTMV